MGDDQTNGGRFRERQHGSDSTEVTVLSVNMQVTLEQKTETVSHTCIYCNL